MWETGAVDIDGMTFLYSAKVFDVGSKFGINNGRISKLDVQTESCNITIINYDRGWDVHPKTELEKKVLNHILDLYK